MQTQIWRNNRNSFLLLCLFPVIILGMVLVFIIGLDLLGMTCFLSKEAYEGRCHIEYGVLHWPIVQDAFLAALPWAVGIVTMWFVVAYCTNATIIRELTHAKPLERRENLRVYNIVENLCIAGGIEMPKINIVHDAQLNAFASGIDAKSFTITLTTGIIDKLDDAELSAVVGHELTHIKNRDTRLMVICIVFVGILTTIRNFCINVSKDIMRGAGRTRNNRGKGGGGIVFIVLVIMVVGLVVSSFALLFSTMTRLAISRKREFVADAGGAELCGDPMALALALQKISFEPGLCYMDRDDVAQLYIVHPSNDDGGIIQELMNKIFSTHPSTPDRIRYLRQF